MATKQKPAEESHLLVAANKKARRDYEIIDELEAGICLKGSEVKSLRQGNINLKDSYVKLKSGEIFLVGSHIAPYNHSPADSHEAVRDRKLLLHKKEITKLSVLVQQKGLTIIPLKIYFSAGRCKVQIGLGRGKKLHDKREDIKSKEAVREIERVMKRQR